MLDIISISNPIFEEVIRDYHKSDDVDRVMVCSYQEGKLEYDLYKKCWIDVVQWHLEDIIRDPAISPIEALAIKRRIDKSNQDRTDMVERLDDYFYGFFSGVVPMDNAKLNTESPAWAIDRLSILHIKIWHMREQTIRKGISEAQRESCLSKLKILEIQLRDLCTAIKELFEDYSSGKKIIKTYKQMKMYNDPNLNPILYGGK